VRLLGTYVVFMHMNPLTHSHSHSHSQSSLVELLRAHPHWQELNSDLLNDCNYYLDITTHEVYEHNNATHEISRASDETCRYLATINKSWMTR
jgi:hypothetical protein